MRALRKRRCWFATTAPLLLLALFAVLLYGCGWQRTMTFPSPSRRAAIEIWQTRLDNSWGTQVHLVAAQRRTMVFENRREAVVYFVHVYWSPDEARVGVLATGGNIWSLACDVATAERIPFERIRDDFAQSIAETYHVPRKEDPIQWAMSGELDEQFFRLHPEIRLTYH